MMHAEVARFQTLKYCKTARYTSNVEHTREPTPKCKPQAGGTQHRTHNTMVHPYIKCQVQFATERRERSQPAVAMTKAQVLPDSARQYIHRFSTVSHCACDAAHRYCSCALHLKQISPSATLLAKMGWSCRTCRVTRGHPDAGGWGEGRFGELGGQGQVGQGLDGGGNKCGAESKGCSAQLHCVHQHVPQGCTGGQA